MSEAFKEGMKEGKIRQADEKFKSAHLKDFEKSGLLEETVKKAGYKSQENGWEVPITNPDTKEAYYTRKRLDKPIKTKDAKGKEKEIRYLTPAGCEPHLYFSLQVDNWSEILSTPTVPLLLTEGEKKADKAIQEGFLCVAVSGIWCWSENHEPIDDLKRICTKNRLIPIVFDSDYKDKPQVQNAIKKLIEAIKSFGAIPVDCSLPGPEKGLDDFLVARGKEALKKHIQDCIKAFIPSYEKEKYHLQEAIKYLSGDVIRNNFLPAVNKAGLVGEERNAVICYVAACSRCSKDMNGSLHATLLGPSAGGKSSIAEKVCEHFITEKYFKERASFTAAAFYRGEENSLKYKCILISEVTHLDQEQEDISALLRTLKTRGKAEREVVTKKNGELVTITLKAEGPCSFIGTTTSFAGKDEDVNRDIFTAPDDSMEQTQRIRTIKNQKLVKYNPGLDKWILENKNTQETVQDLLIKHIPVFVEIPYINRINYPDREERARRDGDKIDKALQAICHINMLNRKIKLLDAKPIIEDIKKFVQGYNFKTFDSYAVVSIQNLELSHDSKENQTISNQNNCTSEVQESKDNYEAVVGIDGEHVVIDSPDSFLNYGILEEFAHRRKYSFVLVSDERDFSLLQQYFGLSIEASYNELGHNLTKYYRVLAKEAERTDNYEFTAARFTKLVNQSDTWTRKILNQLAKLSVAIKQ